MAPRKVQELTVDDDEPLTEEVSGESPPDEELPRWQRRSVERSLQNARRRAQQRSDRFVAAALELLAEREEADCTIQEVVDRSGMSQRTFYGFFDGKDSLLLAVYETILSKTAVPLLRERCGSTDDPVERLRILLDALAEFASRTGPIPRALTVFHLRLAETRPHDLVNALGPLHELITELLTDIAAVGRLRDDLDVRTQAALLQEMLLASLHSVVFTGSYHASTDDLWAFCSAAILKRS